jgi:chromate transporter
MPTLNILWVFALLSVLSIGGGTAVLPEMKRLTTVTEPWLTDDQFRDVYSLGQLAPGPNMLMVAVIGYRVDSWLGAFAAFTAFFLPSCLITFATSRIWDHFRGSPWRLSVQHGLAPMVIGLMCAGVISIARTAIINTTTVVLAALVFGGLYFGKKINPALLILAGGIFGLVFLR